MFFLDEENVTLFATTLKLRVRTDYEENHAREDEVQNGLHFGIHTCLQEEAEHVGIPQRRSYCHHSHPTPKLRTAHA